MIFAAILNIENMEEGTAVPSFFGETLYSHIEKMKDKRRKRESIGAYTLLNALYSDIYSPNELPRVEFSPEGKPFFISEKENIPCPVFNISHDGGYVFAAVSDSDFNIGIDIAAEPERVGLLERVAKRFLSSSVIEKEEDKEYPTPDETVKKSDTRYRVSYKFFENCDGKLLLCDSDKEKEKLKFAEIDAPEKFDSLLRWCELEAIIKTSPEAYCSGGKDESGSEFPTVKSFAEFYNGKRRYCLCVCGELRQ